MSMQALEKEDKRIYILAKEKPAKAVVSLGIPLIAGMFVMVLYNLVDTYFIGRTHNDYQLAAVNLAYPVMMVTIAISNMIGTGASSLIARSLGAGDNPKACHTLTSAFLLTVINSVIVTAAGLLFLPHIVTALGADSDTFEYTKQYVFIVLSGSIFTMGSYTFGQLLRSEGSVKYSIAGMIAGTIVNIVFDPLFIFILNMQIKGAAIATILGNAVSMAVSLWFYIGGKTLLKPDIKYILPTKEILKEIFWVGVPASLETLLTSGTQPIMGYNYGAKNYKRMISVLWAGLAVCGGTELFVMAVYGIGAPYLIGIFTQTAEVIEIGSRVLRTIMLILPFVSAVSMSRMSFQAMGKPQYAFAITLVRQMILYIPLLLLLNNVFGFGGMIWAQPVTEFIMMAVSVILLYGTIKKEEKTFSLK